MRPSSSFGRSAYVTQQGGNSGEGAKGIVKMSAARRARQLLEDSVTKILQAHAQEACQIGWRGGTFGVRQHARFSSNGLELQ